MKSRGRSPVATSTHSADNRETADLAPGVGAYAHGLGALAMASRRLAAEDAGLGVDGGGSALPSPRRNESAVSETNSIRSSNATDLSALGNSTFYDDVNIPPGSTSEAILTQKAIDAIQAKIERTKEQIRDEQASRDGNVNEYLKLSSSADKQQQIRIKQVFEKKNQKSAMKMQDLQRKLEEYMRRMQDLQEHGVRTKHSHKLGQGLKNVSENIRDGISGMSSTVMSKPKEFAHKLRHKFGSADDLSGIGEGGSTADPAAAGKKSPENRNHHGSASLPRENSGGTNSAGGSRYAAFEANKRKCISEDGRRSERSESLATSADSEAQHDHLGPQRVQSGASRTSPQHGHGGIHVIDENAGAQGLSAEWKAVMQELTLHREEVENLREAIADLRQHVKLQVDELRAEIREHSDRYDRLEDQINDLTELHQHEIENIKSGVNDMEEKVQYQSEERLIDIKEHLQGLETKVTSMEHQAAQQQYLNIEGLDTTDARAVMMKLLTAVITFIQVFLFVVGMVMGLARPFLCSTPRALVTISSVLVLGYAYYEQDALVAYFQSPKAPTASKP